MVADPTREQIFALRSQQKSIRQIAAELGLSKSKVERELKARAAPAAADGGGHGFNGSAGLEEIAGAGGLIDPEIRERRRSLERRRLALQEAELEARELEARNRLAVLNKAAAGGGADASFAQLVIEELRELRRRVEDGGPRQGGGAQTVVQALTEYSEFGKLVSTFTPPRAPTSALDLEFEVARDRIREESQRILRKQELDADLARTKAESEAARSNAIAKVIEETGPALIAAATKWLEGQGSKANEAVPTTPSAPAANGGESSSSAAPPMLAGAPAVKGYCPRCGAGEMEVVPTGTDADKCPACGLILAVEAGRIVSADRSLPAPEVQRYAS
jgi:Helix-turn-helix domain